MEFHNMSIIIRKFYINDNNTPNHYQAVSVVYHQNNRVNQQAFAPFSIQKIIMQNSVSLFQYINNMIYQSYQQNISFSWLYQTASQRHIKALYVLFVLLLIEYVHYFYFPRVEQSVVIPQRLLTEFDLGSYRITIAQFYVFYFCSGLNDITVPDIAVIHIGKNSKYIIITYFHYILSLDLWFKYYQGFFFNDIVISKYDLKWFIFILAKNRASGVNNAALAKYDGSLYLVLAQVDSFFIHVLFQPITYKLNLKELFFDLYNLQQILMDSKQQGQKAVSRIIQIRSFFLKTQNLNAKKQYADQFKASILKLVAYLKVQKNMQVVNQLKAKLPQLENQLRNMRTQINSLQAKEQKQVTKKKQVQASKKQIIGKQQPMSELEKGVSNAIVKEKPNIMWDDVAGLDQAKKVLQEAVILPIKFPEVFIGQRTPWRGILLYGPPGTGKTFLAKACATQMKGGTFFSISASDLMSKYVGQSQKTLKALFQMARKQRPSIIFIDEIDSIAGQRSSQQNEVSRRVKTQFLIQMQGVGNECKDVLVLGATNLPWALDSAVRRRFQKRVYIPLPDIKGRLAMIKKVIQKNKIPMNNQQITEVANLTDGYSGSDIANMANDALMSPVRILDKTRTWLEVKDQGKIKYAPYGQNLPKDPNCKYFSGTMQQLKSKGYTIYLQTKYSDFLLALKSSKPSVSPNDLQRYIQFTKTFGMDG